MSEQEIEWLRRREEAQDIAAREADRLVMALLPYYKCDFVVLDMPACYTYGILSGDWRHNNGTCQGMTDRLSRGFKGSVTISLGRLRQLHEAAIQ